MSNVLITGASGFLGGYILDEFHRNNWNVTTLGRSNKSDISCDLANNIPKIDQQFDLVVHNAGMAHQIPRTEEEKATFYAVNLHGTMNLLKGMELQPPSHIVFISTVSVYGLEEGEMITETNSLSANDPYGRSKKEAEMEIEIWAKEHKCKYTILRLPLVVGVSAPGNLNSMISAIKKGRYFSIGIANSKRSMVHAQDVASLIAGNRLESGIFNLTDGLNPTYKELEDFLSAELNKKIRSIPFLLAKVIALIGDLVGEKVPLNSRKLTKLRSTLTFSDQRARSELEWDPSPVLSNKNRII